MDLGNVHEMGTLRLKVVVTLQVSRYPFETCGELRDIGVLCVMTGHYN